MKSLIIALTFLGLIINSAFARCHGGYADHILAQALKCNGGDSISIRDIPGAEAATAAVSGVCMGGCYSAMFNQDLKPECDKEYAGALKKGVSQIQKYATQNNCAFDSAVIDKVAGAGGGADAGPFASCYWVSNSLVNPKNNSCGVTAACFGTGYCSEGEYSGNELTLQCAAVGDSCPTFAECAGADDPAWVTDHTYSKENTDNNGAGATGIQK
jgi:hypothetical protein